MTRLLIDTSAYSRFKRGDNAAVEAVQHAEYLGLNATVLGELRAGFAVGTKKETNEADLREFMESSRVHILPVDEETSIFYATIYMSLRQAGTPVPINDLWIAATAMQHGLAILSADSHFQKIPQVIVEHLA